MQNLNIFHVTDDKNSFLTCGKFSLTPWQPADDSDSSDEEMEGTDGAGGDAMEEEEPARPKRQIDEDGWEIVPTRKGRKWKKNRNKFLKPLYFM